MDCRTFRQLHGLWLDGGLAPRHAARLLSHVGACEGCARFDALVRRALLVARNSDPIAPSADFGERLRRRLAEERLRCVVTDAGLDAIPAPRAPRGLVPLPWRAAAAIALVAGGAMLGAAVTGGTGRGAAPFDSAAIGAAGPSWTALAAPSSFVPPTSPAPAVALPASAPGSGTLVPVGVGVPELRDGEAAAMTPAAPLWPSARMAARAAARFAESEFGPGAVTPVRAVVQLH